MPSIQRVVYNGREYWEAVQNPTIKVTGTTPIQRDIILTWGSYNGEPKIHSILYPLSDPEFTYEYVSSTAERLGGGDCPYCTMDEAPPETAEVPVDKGYSKEDKRVPWYVQPFLAGGVALAVLGVLVGGAWVFSNFLAKAPIPEQ